jgi:uncharacterized phage protein (TIGR02220 family)
MNKSPAFNFYSSDFLTKTTLMNYTQKGKFIHLLCLQHQQGHLEPEDFFDIVDPTDRKLVSQFVLDNEGKYYNEDLEKVLTQKSKHIDKQRENAKKRWEKDTMRWQCDGNAKAMPLEIEIEIDNSNISYKDIIEYLNNKTNRSYNYKAKKNQEMIKARFNEGYTIEDFKKVIDNKCSDWLNDDKMNEYLRPETLFSNKFDGYLNKKRKKTFEEMVEDL